MKDCKFSPSCSAIFEPPETGGARVDICQWTVGHRAVQRRSVDGDRKSRYTILGEQGDHRCNELWYAVKNWECFISMRFLFEQVWRCYVSAEDIHFLWPAGDSLEVSWTFCKNWGIPMWSSFLELWLRVPLWWSSLNSYLGYVVPFETISSRLECKL